ncbi:UvrD-helicase domain-containing protein [Paenibacillus lignilyticus]|uniref:DNA 3'-5' helicase n=1 Tax=Paenibacillus lignilyticus TaxID=1172615 RepID=A0ABS5CK58_9BACL|nr:UvrD-helicase domain-containing protein [Paenibacillus lignilyticus]MBP3966257.1 UvrD-helicase domain-containing protein [Paenibacillus lignilyticus]
MHSDQVARDRIVQDLDTTFLVEAGAGSGKTTSLVGRMIALIENGKATADQIAAITFTRKAADELKNRFRLELEKKLSTVTNEIAVVNLRQALKTIDRCYIGTIHSFCGRLLRERPIEAKLDPMFQEIEEQEALAFRDLCWDEYLLQLNESGQEQEIQTLESLQVSVEDLKHVYNRVSLYTDVHIELQVMLRPDFDLIRLSLPPMIDEAFAYLPILKPEKGWDRLQQMIRNGRRMIQLYGVKDDIRILNLGLLFEREVAATLNRWTDKDMAKQFKVAFQEWQFRVLNPFLRAWREHLYPQVITFVMPAIQYCARRRNELGLLDFQDLLMRATSLLREHKEVRSFFTNRYTRLFVDEFQDTDPIQAELMFLLTGDNPTESNWRNVTPKPGSLFVVGDPKQSIYRFRRADISTYNAVKNKIAAHGEVLQLSSNFRSVHAIGQFVNYDFNSRFPRTESEHQAAFVQMETKLTNPKSNLGAQYGIQTLTVPKLQGGKAVIADADADWVTRYIAWACAGNLKIQERDRSGEIGLRPAVPGDFLILHKRREFLHLYAQKLEGYGIPAVTAGSSTLYEEIISLAALAKSLNDSDDRIALLAVLRGLFFGVSDNALFHYKMEGFPVSYTFLPDRSAVSETAMPVYEALEQLSVYLRKMRSMSALSALMFIIDDLGLIPLAAMGKSGSNRAGTLIKLLYLLQREEMATASWPELCAYVVHIAEEASVEAEDLYAGQHEAVRIMNLHKAKGLEAHVVFLACPCGESDHDASEHINRSGESVKGYFNITRKTGYQNDVIAHPPGWIELAERERLYMNAEKERLLYVAATRAKQLLVISRYPDRPAVDPWSAFESSLRDAKEIEDVQVREITSPVYDVRHDELEDARSGRQQREALAVPSYRVASVTEIAKSAGVQPPRPLAGRGMAFGSTVHRCIELLGAGRTPEELGIDIRAIAAEEGLVESLIVDVMSMLEDVRQHKIWKRGLAAKRRIHELPFRTRMEKVAGDESTVHTLLKGVIDYLFEEEDGWVIVDFKTDVYEDGQLGAFVDFYRPQVKAYADELLRAFGIQVKEAGLWFLHGNEYVRI